MNPTELGGFKELILGLEGEGVYRRLHYESGGHRVQRVPETEAKGRVHTSAATVAVMAEPEDVEIDLKPDDYRRDVFHASGPGGQHVNKTASAVRLTHYASGIVVSCQDEKSQHKNMAKALRVLKTRLYEAHREEEHRKRSDERKSQIGSGDRSQRIRTYNFPAEPPHRPPRQPELEPGKHHCREPRPGDRQPPGGRATRATGCLRDHRLRTVRMGRPDERRRDSAAKAKPTAAGEKPADACPRRALDGRPAVAVDRRLFEGARGRQPAAGRRSLAGRGARLPADRALYGLRPVADRGPADRLSRPGPPPGGRHAGGLPGRTPRVLLAQFSRRARGADPAAGDRAAGDRPAGPGQGPRGRRPSAQVADVGTGSGILAVCAAKHLPTCRVTAIDKQPCGPGGRGRQRRRPRRRRADRIGGERPVCGRPGRAAIRFRRQQSALRQRGGNGAAAPGGEGLRAPRGPVGRSAGDRSYCPPGAASGRTAEPRRIFAAGSQPHGPRCRSGDLWPAEKRLELGPTVKDLARLPRVVTARRRSEPEA